MVCRFDPEQTCELALSKQTLDNLEKSHSNDHLPVLCDEVVRLLVTDSQGAYVDGTFGRGGHTAAVLAALEPQGRVIGLDRDLDAVAHAQSLCEADHRLQIAHAEFGEIRRVLDGLQLSEVQGVLLDLGVSSPQLDNAHRGFSFLRDGPLDMRMNQTAGVTAAEWLNSAEEDDISRVLRSLGEERFARKIARAIVHARPLQTTLELADIVQQAVPGQSGKHPATRTFQAVRMHINNEMGELEAGLIAAFNALAVGGRLAIITFHSLEDRLVKQTYRKLSTPPQLPRRLPVSQDNIAPPLARKIAGPLRASPAEVLVNPRARSASLRVIERASEKPFQWGERGQG